jgi:diguanylate cyclase (GGDEF)-like protein
MRFPQDVSGTLEQAQMTLRLRTLKDVRAFSVALTAVVLLGNLTLQQVLMPPDLARIVRWPGSIIALALAAPLSFFVGLRLLEIHRLYVKLQDTVQHDPVTSVLTRRAFFERLSDIEDSTGVAIMVDIDHFKAFNDNHGHATGDAALSCLARTLINGCRAEDLVARYGGEEFVIYLPDTCIEDGISVAERLREKIARTRIMHDGLKLPVTSSFGVARVESVKHIETAIERADAALYKAKSQGRNRVCFAE